MDLAAPEGPLTPAVLYILLSLSDQPRHGYGIMSEVGKLSEEQVSIGPGTLYGTLQRLEAAGLVEECQGSDLTPTRRRYYQLAGKGRQVLAAELDRLRSVLSAARAKRAHLLPKEG
jgi:DNA-binding PadR family transcriptional regulator